MPSPDRAVGEVGNIRAGGEHQLALAADHHDADVLAAWATSPAKAAILFHITVEIALRRAGLARRSVAMSVRNIE